MTPRRDDAGEGRVVQSYYTVTVALAEDAAGRHGRTATLARRAGHAFLWAVAWWGAAVVVAGTLPGAFVSTRVLTRRPRAAP